MQSMVTYFSVRLQLAHYCSSVISIPVRFTRVYSKVTLGTLSPVINLCLFHEWTNRLIRLMEQTAHNRHNTHMVSLSPAPLFALLASPSERSDGEVRLWLPRCQQPIPHLPLNATSKTYCCAHGFIMSRGQAGGGMGRLAHTWTKQGQNVQACGGEETWTSLDDWAGRRKYEGWKKGCTAEMPLHAANTNNNTQTITVWVSRCHFDYYMYLTLSSSVWFSP